MSFSLKENAQQLVQEEIHLLDRPKRAEPEIALGYPNSYKLGMSNLGFQSIYASLVQQGFGCDRFFLPEKEEIKEYQRTGTALFSLQDQIPLKRFDVVAFSLSFEMDYLHVLEMLRLADLPFFSHERTEEQPLLAAGGPCAFFNPEPLAEMIDVFFVGEGEEITGRFFAAYLEKKAAGLTKDACLRELCHLPGIYIPRFYQPRYRDDGMLVSMEKTEPQAPDYVERQWVQNLDDYETASVIITPHTQFGDMYLTEIARGCGHHCRFCMAGFSYRPPRFRSLEQVWYTVQKGLLLKNKIGLVGAAISDYPWIDELCQRIAEKGGEISVSSLRVNSLTESLLQAVLQSGSKSITIAPEAGSERLRRVINKGVSEADILNVLPLFNQYQIPQIKLYFMLGLPTETWADLEEMIALACKIRDGLQYQGYKRIILGVTPFVPKPFTPFQWYPMEPLKSLEKKMNYLKQAVRKEKCLELNFESPRLAAMQALLARGDRRVGKVLSDTYGKGSLSVYDKALQQQGVDLAFYLYRTRDQEEVFPWSVLLSGVEKAYLWTEKEKGEQEKKTAVCAVGSCRRCGVCGGKTDG